MRAGQQCVCTKAAELLSRLNSTTTSNLSKRSKPSVNIRMVTVSTKLLRFKQKTILAGFLRTDLLRQNVTHLFTCQFIGLELSISNDPNFIALDEIAYNEDH